MVMRVVKEIERYISELGTEGRLITMQMEELVVNVETNGVLVIQDYANDIEKLPEHILDMVNSWPAEDLLDLALIARALGYSGNQSILEQNVIPRGYRVLRRIPRLPVPVIENLVNEFGTLQHILRATIEQLDDVEGIGEVRARSIKEGLGRYRDKLLQDRNRIG
jgi:diadenylate cyclase